jgi:hypothetical protein
MSFTPLPNNFIDQVMPTLKDTEWRLLCIIARQTLGWSDGKGKRRERDWLSQSQLKARTGRQSASISAALDALIRHRLIDAFDARGNLLLTPEQRRRHRGPIFYGLCQIASNSSGSKNEIQSEIQKANTTKEINDKRNIKIGRDKRHQIECESPNFIMAGWHNQSLDGPVIYKGWINAGDVASQRYRRN